MRLRTAQGPIETIEVLPGDSPLAPNSAFEARRRLILFAGIGIAAYAVAMVATMPASVFLKNRPWRTGVSGTLWNGEAGLAGGSRLEWHWAPLRSITSLGFAADWHATGPNTHLGGRVLARPGRVVLDKVSGAADATLLRALQPDLPFVCDMTMQVEMPRIEIGGGDTVIQGNIASDPGSCAPRTGGAASAVEPLYLSAEPIGDTTRIRISPRTQRLRTLVQADLTRAGATRISMTADGAAALPFAGLPGGASIEGHF